MEIFLFWIGLAIVVGVAANKRGRDRTGWSVLAIVISPLLAGLLLLALPRLATPVKRDPRWANLRSTTLPDRPEVHAPLPAPATLTPNGFFYIGMSVWVVLLVVGIAIIAGVK